MIYGKFLNLGDGLHELFHNPQADKMAIIQELFFTLNGRLNRKSLIYRWLFMSLVLDVPYGICSVLSSLTFFFEVPLFGVACILGIIGVINSISMAVRRFHDIGKSGWWTLLLIIPIVNFFTTLFLLFCGGDDGPNPYGEDPLQ